jgi:hypothetical protein
MAKITDLDILELRNFFEEALSRAQRADKRQKMRMRKKIRDEVFILLTWEKPTPKAILNRWEERLQDVFKVMPFGFKEELFKILMDKMTIRMTLDGRRKLQTP